MNKQRTAVKAIRKDLPLVATVVAEKTNNTERVVFEVREDARAAIFYCIRRDCRMVDGVADYGARFHLGDAIHYLAGRVIGVLEGTNT